MACSRVELLTAGFLDSTQARGLKVRRAEDVRRATLLLVSSAIENVGVDPRLLDGEQVRTVLLHWVARKLGRDDGLASQIPAVARSFFNWLGGIEMLPNGYEIDAALGEIDGEFLSAARAVDSGERIPGKGETVRHRGTKVGRNEPCPCGSGRKFKRCCMRRS